MKSRLTDVVFAIVAFVVLAANYEGLALVVGADELKDHLFALLLAIAAGGVTFVFWKLTSEYIPELTRFDLRVGAWALVFVAASFFLSFSAWWTTAAIAGRDALAAHATSIAATAEDRVAEVTERAGGFTALIPRVTKLASDLTAQAECERQSGCVTGSSGPGGIGSLLSQMAASATNAADSAIAAEARLSETSGAAKQCLTSLRTSASKDDTEAFATSLDCLNGALGEIANIGAGQQLALAMSTFTDGIVIPVNVSSESQIEAAKRLIEGVRASASAIASSAATVVEAEAAAGEAIAFRRISAMQAVLEYAHAIAPAIATAVALDLSPILLLVLQSIQAAALRGKHGNALEDVTVREVQTAIRARDALYGEVQQVQPNPDILPAPAEPRVRRGRLIN